MVLTGHEKVWNGRSEDGVSPPPSLARQEKRAARHLSRLGVELHEAAATFPYQATFKEPEQYATGIEWILINGRAVVEEGKPTGALPGRVLLGPGTK